MDALGHPEELTMMARRILELPAEQQRAFLEGPLADMDVDEAHLLAMYVARERCKTDLYYLAKEVLGYTYCSNLHRDMAKIFTAPRGDEFVGHLYPRGHLKTTVCTISGTIQRYLQFPDSRFLIGHATLDNGKLMCREMQWHHMKNVRFRELFPEHCYPDETTKLGSMEQFVTPARSVVRREPTVRVGSVETNLVSTHCDGAVFDDLNNLENCRTRELRDKIEDWFNHALSLLDPVTLWGGKPFVDLVATRWHDDDLVGRQLRKRPELWRFTIRGALEHEGRPYLSGDPIFPPDDESGGYGFSSEYLQQLRKRQGPSVFACQYMNEPVDDDTAIFRRSGLRYWENLPDRNRQKVFVHTTVDPAISDEDGSDFTAIVTCFITGGGLLYVAETRFGRWDVMETIHQIFQVVETWNPRVVGIEGNAFQKSLSQYMRQTMLAREVFFPIQELKAWRGLSKDMRVRALEPFWHNGQILLGRNQQELEEQLLRYHASTYKDLADALAYHVELFRKPKDGLGVVNEFDRRQQALDPSGADLLTNKFPPGTYGFMRKWDEERPARLRERQKRIARVMRRLGA